MVRSKRKTVKRAKRQSASARSGSSGSSSGSKAPSLDIKSSADVKKALEIMRKHPLTIVLVFANWCPHCHTFMGDRWNKYKSLPNRTSPMISVEQQQSAELLKSLRGENGESVSVNAFPTVLASTTVANSASNIATPVSTGNDSAMISLLENGSNAVTGSSGMSGMSGMSDPSATASLPVTGSDPMNLNNSESASSGPENASNSHESIKTARRSMNTETASGSAGQTPFVRASLGKAIRNAVNAATARRAASAKRRKVGQASQTPILSAINGNSSNKEYFAKPPRLTMGGGGGGNGNVPVGPSGLIKMTGGGMSNAGSLYHALKQYSRSNHTRKNNA